MDSRELVVLVPVLGRPHRVKPTLDAFSATVPDARVLFIASPGDDAELEELKDCGADVLVTDGGYAQKVRAGLGVTLQPFVFTAADDLEPQPDWFENACGHMDNGVQVVGVNDLIDRTATRGMANRVHATSFLMTRAYANTPTIDGGPGPFSDVYFHWKCDDELIATAKKRGVYAYAPDSHVRHLHYLNGLSADDSTYVLGRSRAVEDRKVFRKRVRLWAA